MTVLENAQVRLPGSLVVRQMAVTTTNGTRGTVRFNGKIIVLEFSVTYNIWFPVTKNTVR